MELLHMVVDFFGVFTLILLVLIVLGWSIGAFDLDMPDPYDED